MQAALPFVSANADMQAHRFRVAQICNLPYRRIVSCRATGRSGALGLADALPTASLRYGRLQVCATNRAITLNTDMLAFGAPRLQAGFQAQLF